MTGVQACMSSVQCFNAVFTIRSPWC